MKYMGSKNRIAKHILPIMLAERKDGQYWVEPFVGGANMIDKVDGNRIGADKNKYIISMWQGLQNNLDRPYTISKELYSRVRTEYNSGTNINFDDFLIGWIGWMASFNGRFFDGGYSGANGTRNYIDEQIRNTEKQIENIKDIEFIFCDYLDLKIPDNSLIYCDIPYRGTKQYATSKNFCHDTFWQWARDMTKKGHTVFISEYSAPCDFECVWQKEVTNSMNTNKTYKPTERLFRYKK
jgi:DNA adenine methylase